MTMCQKDLTGCEIVTLKLLGGEGGIIMAFACRDGELTLKSLEYSAHIL